MREKATRWADWRKFDIRIAGIYQILNIKNGKRYIGSSVDIELRWYNHRKELNEGIHHSPYLQSAWNKYGEDSFEFSVLQPIDPQIYEKVELDKLIRTEEQYYLDLFLPFGENGYNIAVKSNGGPKGYAEKDLKEGRCPFTEEQFNTIVEKLKNPLNFLVDISIETGVPEHIVERIYHKEYILLTKNLDFPPRKRSRIESKIEEIEKMFDEGKSYEEISKKVNLSAPYIKEELFRRKGKRKSIRKPVYRFDLKGNFIKEYPSLVSAAEDTGKGETHIKTACVDQTVLLAQSIWSYDKEKIRDFTLIEKIIGRFLYKEEKPYIQYNENKEPIGIFVNRASLNLIEYNPKNKKVNKSSLVSTTLMNKDGFKQKYNNSYWRKSGDLSEEELLNIKNNNKIKIYDVPRKERDYNKKENSPQQEG